MDSRQEQIKSLIYNHSLDPAAESGDWPTVYVGLTDKVIRKTDASRKIKDDLIDKVGAINANLVMASIAKAGRDEIPGVPDQLALSEWHNLSGVGSDMSRPGLQAFLDGVGMSEGWDSQLLQDVKEMGVWHISIAEDAGLEDEEQTLDQAEIEEAWFAWKLEQRITNARAQFEQAVDQFSTDAELKTAWEQAWEQSV